MPSGNTGANHGKVGETTFAALRNPNNAYANRIVNSVIEIFSSKTVIDEDLFIYNLQAAYARYLMPDLTVKKAQIALDLCKQLKDSSEAVIATALLNAGFTGRSTTLWADLNIGTGYTEVFVVLTAFSYTKAGERIDPVPSGTLNQNSPQMQLAEVRLTATLQGWNLAVDAPGYNSPLDTCAGNGNEDSWSSESRGQSRGGHQPQNLNEQLAVEQAISNPKAGTPLKSSDPRWPTSEGWTKQAQNINGIEVHYQYNTVTGQIDDIKIK